MNKWIVVISFSLMCNHFLLNAQQNFQNVTSSMGISGQTGLGHAVGWGDIDNDGDPELGLSNQEGDGFWIYLISARGACFSDFRKIVVLK